MQIFINYRHNDTGKYVKDLAQRLKRHFGEMNVILDSEDFKAGHDFREEIRQNLSPCNVVLVVIGENWLEELEKRANSRSSDDQDWVLYEIEYALSHDKLVIPVLLNCSMPNRTSLPKSIENYSFSFRNAVTVSASFFQHEVDTHKLISEIEEETNTYHAPERDTSEYVQYLLLTSKWSHASSENGNEEYLCDKDNTYRIVILLHSEEVERNKQHDWLENFYGTHTMYPVVIEKAGQQIDKHYFMAVSNANDFVPYPEIMAQDENGKAIYCWNIYSTSMRIARHIIQFRLGADSFESFAQLAGIELIAEEEL